MDKIQKAVHQSFFTKIMLCDLISKATEPCVYKKNGYIFVTNGREEACESVMVLRDIDGVLTDKRYTDEVPRIDAKRQKLNRKTRTPNTTRSQDRFVVVMNIQVFEA